MLTPAITDPKNKLEVTQISGVRTSNIGSADLEARL
jgi:hypothetical protein